MKVSNLAARRIPLRSLMKVRKLRSFHFLPSTWLQLRKEFDYIP